MSLTGYFIIKIFYSNKYINYYLIFFSLSGLANFIREADEGLLQPVSEGDYEGLVSVMGFLMHVKERQEDTDEMFEPLHNTIELLKYYDQELPEQVNVLLQVIF